MKWRLTHRCDPKAAKIADRHYNRQTPGSPQFVPPGRCIVLVTPDYSALWVTSWPKAEFTKHEWAGAWVNTLFRNEGGRLSSKLIRQAVAATRFFWQPPESGLVTFIDSGEVESDNPGYCYKCAGFEHVGYTESEELHAVQLVPGEMPEPEAPSHAQRKLIPEAS